MEVTRSNFQALLPEIESTIVASDFISIDTELTGLSSGLDMNAFDTPSECYHVLRRSTQEFLLIQIGLTAFRWDAESKTYKYSAYTFYIFPRQELKYAADKIFTCQSSSIDFLSRHKFDFNKLFYEGISYVDLAQEVKLRDATELKQNAEMSYTSNDSFVKNTINIPDNIQPQIDQICKDVEVFLKENNKEQIEFPNLNSFIRKLVYQELTTKFDDSIYVETISGKEDQRIMVVSHAISEEKKKEKIADAHRKEWQALDAAIGFSNVARIISESKKLVVGHNVCLDLLHFMNDFFCPLPNKYSEFKNYAIHIFPSILDTMYMAKSRPIKDNVASYNLKTLHEILNKEPFKMPKYEPEDHSKLHGFDVKSENYHNAGYDAFVTGLCLLSMFEFLRNAATNGSELRLDSNCELIKPFINKLYLHRTSFQGLPCLNLSGSDSTPSRKHVFYIEYPKDWTRQDIAAVFEEYGGINAVSNIDSTSAYVSLRNPDQAERVLKVLHSKQFKCKLIPYWEHKKSLSSPPEELDKAFTIKMLAAKERALNAKLNELERLAVKRKHEESEGPESKDLSNSSADSLNSSVESISSPLSVLKNRKERKLSQMPAGKSTAASNGRNKSKFKVSNVFKESDNWE